MKIVCDRDATTAAFRVGKRSRLPE